MTVLVHLVAALICFQDNCYPILYGKSTPIGEFQLVLRLTESAGYGGDVIQFAETDNIVYAIHRLWLLKPEQKREVVIYSAFMSHTITNGCINVEPKVYEKLKDCCSNDKLVIAN